MIDTILTALIIAGCAVYLTKLAYNFSKGKSSCGCGCSSSCSPSSAENCPDMSKKPEVSK